MLWFNCSTISLLPPFIPLLFIFPHYNFIAPMACAIGDNNNGGKIQPHHRGRSAVTTKRGRVFNFITKTCSPISFCSVLPLPESPPTSRRDGRPAAAEDELVHAEFRRDEEGMAERRRRRRRWMERGGGEEGGGDDQNNGGKCACGRDDVARMVPVRFGQRGANNRQNYLLSMEQMGHGGFAVIYHSTKISLDWNFEAMPGECVAIKVAMRGGQEGIDKLAHEKEVMEAIWKGRRRMGEEEGDGRTSAQKQQQMDHLIGYKGSVKYESRGTTIRNNGVKKGNAKRMALLLEIGEMDLKQFWKGAMGDGGQFKRVPPPESLLLGICRQILLGMKQIHDKGYILVDFKTENVIITKAATHSLADLHAKLIDFADSIAVTSPDGRPQAEAHLTTSREYAAPEIYLVPSEEFYRPRLISQKTDIYSFAMVTLELLLMTPKFGRELAKKGVIRGALTREEFEPKNYARDWSVEIRQKMVEWVFLGREEAKNGVVEKLHRKLERQYPVVMEMLKECFVAEQTARPTAGELLEKYFGIKMAPQNIGEEEDDANAIVDGMTMRNKNSKKMEEEAPSSSSIHGKSPVAAHSPEEKTGRNGGRGKGEIVEEEENGGGEIVPESSLMDERKQKRRRPTLEQLFRMADAAEKEEKMRKESEKNGEEGEGKKHSDTRKQGLRKFLSCI